MNEHQSGPTASLSCIYFGLSQRWNNIFRCNLWLGAIGHFGLRKFKKICKSFKIQWVICQYHKKCRILWTYFMNYFKLKHVSIVVILVVKYGFHYLPLVTNHNLRDQKEPIVAKIFERVGDALQCWRHNSDPIESYRQRVNINTCTWKNI